MSDAILALKSGDSKKSQALRYLVSLIDKHYLKSANGEVSESVEIGVLQKELKNKQESLEAFAKAGREDLVDEVKQEIDWLGLYLPKMLTDEELEKIVDEVVQSEKNFGMIMKQVAAKAAGRADGARIAQIVKCKI